MARAAKTGGGRGNAALPQPQPPPAAVVQASADRAHAVFSPSAAHRWLLCPGSFKPNLLAPDTTSEHAQLGTDAHAAAEAMLRAGPGVNTPYPAHLAEHIAPILEYVKWAREAAEGANVVYIEKKVDFSTLTPIENQFGTLDHCVIHGSDRGAVAVLTDLKFGTGVRVYAERNPQLMIYALAIFLELDFIFDFKRFDLRVCQPRLGVFDTWECSRAELLEFAEVVKRQAVVALRDDAPRVPGEKQCQFCKVKGTCPAVLDALHQIADESFEVLEPLTPARQSTEVAVKAPTLPKVEDLTIEQRATVLGFRKLVEGWFKAVHESLEAEALAGATIPGWKLAEGKSNRKWGDEAKAVEALSVWLDDPYGEPEVLSPAQAEKALAALDVDGMDKATAKKLVGGLTVKPAGKISLVSTSASGDAIETGDAFEALE